MASWLIVAGVIGGWSMLRIFSSERAQRVQEIEVRRALEVQQAKAATKPPAPAQN
jgi:hypothetical protein